MKERKISAELGLETLGICWR